MGKGRTGGRPGQIAKVSGQYRPKLGRKWAGMEVTIIEGKPFPPAQVPDVTFVLVDTTKHDK